MPAESRFTFYGTGKTVFWLVAVTAVVFDQVSKVLMSPPFVPLGKSITLVPSLLALVSRRSNPRGAFGIGPSWSWFYIAAGLIGLGIITYVVHRIRQPRVLLQSGLGLLWGGALGNVIDRCLFGAVRDFIDLHWKEQLHWPTFNLADMAICVGIGLVVLEAVTHPGPARQADPQDASAEHKSGTH